MAPMVFNAVPSRLIQIDMGGSVGRGGANRQPDVRVVQALLNSARTSGSAALQVDGMVGPLTIRAIEGFQIRTLGSADGHVDVGARTIRALVEALQQKSEPVPNLAGISEPPGQVREALVDAASRPRSALFGPGRRPSSWRLVTSQGLSISGGPFGVSNGVFVVEQDPPQSRKLKLSFTAGGFGLSVLPAGIEQGLLELPSQSLGRIMMGPMFLRNDLAPEDFVGGIQIFDASAGFGSKPSFAPGIGSFVDVAWGPKGAIAEGMMVSRSHGTPNAGVSLLFGRVFSQTPM